MKTIIEKYVTCILVAIIGMLMITLGIYELTTATSNIATFRMIGVAPCILGVALIGIAPILKD